MLEIVQREFFIYIGFAVSFRFLFLKFYGNGEVMDYEWYFLLVEEIGVVLEFLRKENRIC